MIIRVCVSKITLYLIACNAFAGASELAKEIIAKRLGDGGGCFLYKRIVSIKSITLCHK
jgi:hypothetical protein